MGLEHYIHGLRIHQLGGVGQLVLVTNAHPYLSELAVDDVGPVSHRV